MGVTAEVGPIRQTQTLLFRTGCHLCALAADAVREIVPIPYLDRTPGQPPVIEGFMNLRGTAVPVIRLERLFDMPDTRPGLYAHVILLKGGQHPMGILVDRVEGLYTPREQDRLPLQDNASFNRCAEAELATPYGNAQLLSRDRLLLEQERRCIIELQARAQQYLAQWGGSGE